MRVSALRFHVHVGMAANPIILSPGIVVFTIPVVLSSVFLATSGFAAHEGTRLGRISSTILSGLGTRKSNYIPRRRLGIRP